MMIRAAVLTVALLAAVEPCFGQTSTGLTPLGPMQTPRPSAPAQLPAVVTPSQAPAIQSQPLPVLTPPDPALPTPAAPVPPAVAPRVPPPVPPPVPSPVPSPVSPPVSQSGTPIAGDWQARTTADLVALDKVTARTTTLTGKVGETLRFGSLSIAVRGCVARAPDQIADSAVFLDITDRKGAVAVFRGWMIASMPAVAILEHPVYDIRLASCRP